MHAYEVNMHHLPLLKIECGVMAYTFLCPPQQDPSAFMPH